MIVHQYVTERHGETSGGKVSPEYLAYHQAKGRCRNKSHKKFRFWGGRGIEFRFESFGQFLAEVGRKPTTKHLLDRKDNNGHYEPGNVRWVLYDVQQNNRRSNRKITANNETLSLGQWAKRLGVGTTTISMRIDMYGWCVNCAITLPRRGQCPHRTR